jgi:parallel beta-helix repeat protein
MSSLHVCSAAQFRVRPWLLPLLFLFLLAATVLPTFAAIINVPADYPLIQSAVYLSNPGDTIIVAPGTYAPFDFDGKTVTVESSNPTSPSVVASTVINGSAGANCVIFQHGEGPNSVLNGFTLFNATASGAAGIVVTTSSGPTINNCVIRNNAMGVNVNTTSPALVENCTIENNTGFGVSASCACHLSNDTIAANAGGLSLTGAAQVVDCVIYDNTCTTDGGGVLCNATGIQLKGNLIYSNTTDGHGGGVCCDLGTDLESNTIYANSAGVAGGNIYAVLNTVIVHNCIVTNAPAGGGIGVATGIIPEIAYCDVWNNQTANYAGLPDPTGSRGNISANPLFVGAFPGDFHLQSQAGHYTATGYVTDAQTSPCIGAGDPTSPYNLQPSGTTAIEIGAYGDTAQASKSNGLVAPPTITKGPTVTPSPVIVGTAAACTVTATDKPAYTLSYQWTCVDASNNPAGSFDNANAQNPHWTAPATITGNSQQFTMKVLVNSSSGKNVSGMLTVTVIVLPPDAINITAGPTPTPATIQVSQTTACSVTATDADAYALTYAWTAVDASDKPAGSFDNAAAAAPHWTAPAAVVGAFQLYTLKVVITDPPHSATNTGSVVVKVIPKPDAVTITAGPKASPATISQGQPTSLSVTATDAQSHPLTYLWTAKDSGGALAGSFDNTSLQNPKWTAPTGAASTQIYTLKVVVDCPATGASATQSISVTVQAERLIVNTPANGDANPVIVGGTVDCNVSITDSLGYGVTLAWTAKDNMGNSGGSFDNPASATPIWTAPASLSGSQATYTLKVSALSSQGIATTSSFTTLVVAANTFTLSLPAVQATATGVSPASAAPGSSFTFEMTYLDTANLPPDSVEVHVWAPNGTELVGSPFLMVPSTTTYRTGALFTTSQALFTDGNYSYQFVVQGPTGSVKKLPTGTGRQVGPYVNTPPQANWLGTTGYVDGGVEPTSGAAGTSFTFKVLYSEAEGYAPTFVRLWIWNAVGGVMAGSPFTMTTTNASPNYFTGVVFQKTLTLSVAGTRQYRFEVSDGGPSVTLPASGTTLGPVVGSAPAPTAVDSVTAERVGEGMNLTYTLAASAQVEIEVLNIAGRTIADLPVGPQALGLQSYRWNGRNLTGSLVPPGLYLLRVTARADDGSQAQGLTTVNLTR